MGNLFKATIFLFIIMSAMSVASAQQAIPNPPPSPAPEESSQQQQVEQFQQWLATHGYAAQNKIVTAHQNSPSPAASNNLPPNVSLSSPTRMPPASPPPPRRKMQHRPMTFEESQQAMINSAPPTNMPLTEDQIIAFNTMLQQNMPMNPQQIVQLRQQIDLSQRAAAVPPLVPPKPVSSTLMINLAPGTTPPAVRLAQGYVSSLVFVDSAGSPWPIAAFDIGNPKAVNIQWDGKSNILLLQAVLPYSDGDIVIRLVGLPTPITLELVAGQRVVDFRVDIHVSGIGPNTKELPVGTALPNSANQLLLNVLDGIAPPGSKALTVVGADSQAWLLGSRIFLRTRLTVLSPGWIGKMVSPDGMQAYEMPKTSSVLISRYGEPAEIKIEGL